jgi:spermidine synthase
VSGARLVRQDGRRAIAVDDVVQSIEVRADDITPGYWPEMLPARIGRRALLLGHGGGTVAHLLLRLSRAVEVLAVDDDEAVLALARSDPRLRIDDPRLTLEHGDAFAFARRLVEVGERFDHIAVDLYRGKEMVRAALARPFLRRVSALLEPDGTVAFNLPRDRRTARRLRRLGQHLGLVETRLVGLNCVVHCRRAGG